MKRSGYKGLFAFLTAITVLMASCVLFKHTFKTTTQDHQSVNDQTALQISDRTNKAENAKRFTFTHDTANMNYSMQFWPKGKLIFSPDGGFSGEFDRVQLEGSLKKISQSAETLAYSKTKIRDTQRGLKASHQMDLNTKDEKKKSFPDWVLTFACAVIVVFIAVKLINMFKINE